MCRWSYKPWRRPSRCCPWCWLLGSFYWGKPQRNRGTPLDFPTRRQVCSRREPWEFGSFGPIDVLLYLFFFQFFQWKSPNSCTFSSKQSIMKGIFRPCAFKCPMDYLQTFLDFGHLEGLQGTLDLALPRDPLRHILSLLHWLVSSIVTSTYYLLVVVYLPHSWYLEQHQFAGGTGCLFLLLKRFWWRNATPSAAVAPKHKVRPCRWTGELVPSKLWMFICPEFNFIFAPSFFPAAGHEDGYLQRQVDVDTMLCTDASVIA